MIEEKKETTKEVEVSEEKKENKTPQFIGNSKKEDEKSLGHRTSDLRELLEKNLKWSQIIYEQNRRISRRLLWSSIAAWLKWIIILGVIVWGAWYGWPIVKNLTNQYESIMKQLELPDGKVDNTTLEKILKILPLNQSQQEQIKAMTK